jgi:hypothetical protein
MSKDTTTTTAADLPPVPVAQQGLADAARMLARKDGITVASAVDSLRRGDPAEVAPLAAEYRGLPELPLPTPLGLRTNDNA